ncbi:MAG TPA: NrfD/PsrC family molybdoenzyme membrane anchor subunit [Anaerolineae bacterium]|nr:NrfD/PsrC family molybdoenzyme membrane anchor subunit [Anaerolineae bacterium]
MSKTLQKIIWGVAIVAFLVGLVGLYQRFALGHQAANYGSYVPWGLWIAAYTMFVGASAGAFGLAAVIFMFRLEPYYRLARLAMLIALATFIAGMVSVSLDLGHPFRAWKLLFQTSTSSVMGWMAWVYLIYGILLLVGLWLTRREVIPPFMQRFAFLVFFFAIAFAGAEGALFGVVGARAAWESGLTPILFLVEGALFGLGFVVACAYLFDQLTNRLATRLGWVLLGLLGMLVVLEWAEYSTGLYAATPAKSQTLQTILSGPYWWVFWIFHVGLGVVLPGLLLLFGRGQLLATAIAGALIGAMGLASKLNLVVPALAQEELDGLTQAFTGPGLTFVYFPSTMEWLVWVWTVGLAALVVLVGYRVFALSKPVTGTSREPISSELSVTSPSPASR